MPPTIKSMSQFAAANNPEKSMICQNDMSMNPGSSIWLNSFEPRPLNVSLLGSCDVVTNFGTTEHVGVGPSTFGHGENSLDSNNGRFFVFFFFVYFVASSPLSLEDTCQWKMKTDTI